MSLYVAGTVMAYDKLPTGNYLTRSRENEFVPLVSLIL